MVAKTDISQSRFKNRSFSFAYVNKLINSLKSSGQGGLVYGNAGTHAKMRIDAGYYRFAPIENRKSKIEKATYDAWGKQTVTDPSLTALRENYMYDLGRSAGVTKNVQITHAQKARFDAFINKPRANNWGILKNCSYFASKSFNYATGLNVSAHPFMIFTPTPAWLVRTLSLK